MEIRSFPRIRSVAQLYELLPEEERIIVDMLRQIVREHLPARCKEKIAFNVPFFYGKKGICIIWPATVPRGGIKKGVLFGFWNGNKLNDPTHYLTHGTNKKVFYKIYLSPVEIEVNKLVTLIREAVILDNES